MNVEDSIWDKLTRVVIGLLLLAGLLGVGVLYLPLIRQNENYRKRVLELDLKVQREMETKRQYSAAIEAMNGSGKPILALDLPSGLDCDAGQPLGTAVRAHVTASFVAPKLGFANPGAAEYTGDVEVVEIGLPRCLIEGFLPR